MIVSSKVIDVSLQRSGRFRARFKYTLSDGREVLRGPINCISEVDALAKMSALEPSVNSYIQQQDSERAVHEGIESASGEASVSQVRAEWLLQAYKNGDHYQAYLKLKNVGQAIFSQGKTDAEYASDLGITENEVVKIKQYWSFLRTNKTVIQAYGELPGVPG